jgi:hypothetical protein
MAASGMDDAGFLPAPVPRPDSRRPRIDFAVMGDKPEMTG